ncbi:MAG: hypothetical protein WC476_00825 [Phycisphaerae bacterium]|jgi:hypothetical protein
MSKYFPCPICHGPICHGSGGEKEVILDDGSGPWYECGYCEGKGCIEIGGKLHETRMLQRLAGEIYKFHGYDFMTDRTWRRMEKKLQKASNILRDGLLPDPEKNLAWKWQEWRRDFKHKWFYAYHGVSYKKRIKWFFKQIKRSLKSG